MSGRVLLINQGVAFLTNALISNLKSSETYAIHVGYEMDVIRKYDQTADLYLFFTDMEIGQENQFEILRHLQTLCLKHPHKHLCLIGYSKSLAVVEEMILNSAVDREFQRPIDIKTLTEEICEILARDAGSAIDEQQSILLVDDDVAYLQVLKKWLEKKYRVTAVKSGMQAITYIATHSPDLILLDYDMPIVSGPQVFEMIRSEPSTANIPIMFLTGLSDKEKVMEVIHLKPDGYILKSSAKSIILATIDEFLGNIYDSAQEPIPAKRSIKPTYSADKTESSRVINSVSATNSA